MISKGYLRFVNRINYFDIDMEIVEMLIYNQGLLAGREKIFQNITNIDYPLLYARKNSAGSRKIVLEHLKKTIHVAYVKEIYEEVSEYFQYILKSATIKNENIDINRLIGDNKINLDAVSILSAGSWSKITQDITHILFKQLECERSTIELIRKINNKLNLDVDQIIIKNAMPYLDIRHVFVHQNGVVTTEFKNRYPCINTTGKNEILLNDDLMKKAKENVIKLVSSFDSKMIEKNLFPRNELQP